METLRLDKNAKRNIEGNRVEMNREERRIQNMGPMM